MCFAERIYRGSGEEPKYEGKTPVGWITIDMKDVKVPEGWIDESSGEKKLNTKKMIEDIK